MLISKVIAGFERTKKAGKLALQVSIIQPPKKSFFILLRPVRSRNKPMLGMEVKWKIRHESERYDYDLSLGAT